MALPAWLAKNVGEAAGVAAGGVIDAIGGVIDKVFTSDEEREAARAMLEKLRQRPDELQVELNKIEAAHSSVFVAGWRPAIGWVCALSLAVYYVPRFVLGTLFWVYASWQAEAMLPLPEMGIQEVLGLCGSMLGMAWMRTHEKINGVAR